MYEFLTFPNINKATKLSHNCPFAIDETTEQWRLSEEEPKEKDCKNDKILPKGAK